MRRTKQPASRTMTTRRWRPSSRARHVATDHAAAAAQALGLDMHADGRGPEGAYVEAQGQSFHYLDLGEGAPCVFLHGGGPGCTGWTDFGPVAPHFARDRR